MVLVGLNNDDYEHSKEVNHLENLMIVDLESVLLGEVWFAAADSAKEDEVKYGYIFRIPAICFGNSIDFKK